MIFGLGAALAWGFADFGAAVVGRRIGSLATLLAAQIAGLSAIGIFFATVRPVVDASGADTAVLLANGAVVAVAYVALYRALELGPVALVSPIAAAYAVVTILLAVVFLGESLAGAVLVGAVLTLLGVVLTSTDLRQPHSGRQPMRAGIVYALGSMVAFGFSTFVIGRYSKELGWLVPVAVSRIGSMVALVAVVATVRRSVLRGAKAPVLWAAVALGLVDVLGISSYARGTELGLVSVVTAVSATFPLIPIAGGVLLLGERPAPSQSVGVALVVCGLVLLGLAQ